MLSLGGGGGEGGGGGGGGEVVVGVGVCGQCLPSDI